METNRVIVYQPLPHLLSPNMVGERKTRAAGEPKGATTMYTSQCSSGYGDSGMCSSFLSNVSSPSTPYDHHFEKLESKCFAIDQRLNSLENKLVELFSNKGRLARRRRQIAGSSNPGESWEEIVAYSTTVHGLKEVLTERHPFLKALWITLFIGAVAAMIFYNATVALEYLNDPTATQVRIIRKEKYDFPVMLLCPDTWLDAPKALSAGISMGGLKFALTYLINYGVTPATYTFHSEYEYDTAVEDFFRWYYNDSNNISNIAEFFKFAALDGSDFIVDYFYSNATMNSSGLGRFQKVIMNEAVCYNLSLDPTEGRVALSELDFLVVDVPDRSMGLLRRQTHWRLFVNPDVNIAMSDTHYVQTFPRHSNTVRIMPRRFKSAALKSTDCKTAADAASNDYTQATCVADCMSQSDAISASGFLCTPLMFYRSDHVPHNLSCTCHSYPFWPPQKIPVEKLVNTPNSCVQQCPPLCDKWIYDCTIEAHRIIDNDIMNSLARSPAADEYRRMRGITKYYFLNEIIHYGGVLEFEEVLTYSFETMVSNLGGQMGLWLGASLMSIIQLIMLLTNLCVEKRRRRRR